MCSLTRVSLLCPQILHHIHAVTGVRVPYLPHGPLPDVLPQVPTSDWVPLDHTPWWLDSSFVVGYVSNNTRPVRVMNVLTKQETTIEVRACGRVLLALPFNPPPPPTTNKPNHLTHTHPPPYTIILRIHPGPFLSQKLLSP